MSDKIVNYDLRKLQLEQLSILDEFKRVCDKNNLVFYLAYGTCLGAVRHQGFIPWDDDIDVLMPVADYDKLMDMGDQFGSQFFLQNADTDSGFSAAIARIRKNNTSCIEREDLNMACHQGIFIDIYPLYHYPDLFFQRLHIISASIFYRLLLANYAPKNHGKIINFLGKVLLAILSKGNKKRKMERWKKILRSYHDTKYVADLYGMDLTLTRVIKYQSNWFLQPHYALFEGREMPLPTEAKKYLTERYGDDFMKIPPIEKRHSYHKYFYVDFDKGYSKL